MKPPVLNHKVSVVIPVKNAGGEFPALLQKLKSQAGIRELEVVVVDSGSSDGSVAIAKKHGCKVIQIRPDEFSHSHSRNLGAQKASGDFILFMVQDAFPAGNNWAHALLGALLNLSKRGVVAVTCREFPRMDADLFYGFLMHEHYKHLEWPHGDKITQLTGDDAVSLRKNGALNDIACLIGKKIFDRYKYRGYFGEDLDLGARLLQDGHKLALLSSVKVIHSHNRDPYYFLKRHFVASRSQGEGKACEVNRPLVDAAEALASVYLIFKIMDRLAQNVSSFKPGQPAGPLWNKIHGELVWEMIRIKLDKSPARKGWELLDDRELISFLERFRSASASAIHADELIRRIMERCRAAQDYLLPIYPAADECVIASVAGLLLKLTAAVCGDFLAGLYKSGANVQPSSKLMISLRGALGEGI